MANKNKVTILNRFTSKGIEKVKRKYRSLTKEKLHQLASIIKKVEENDMNFYSSYLNFDATQALAEDLKDEEDIEVNEFHINNIRNKFSNVIRRNKKL